MSRRPSRQHFELNDSELVWSGFLYDEDIQSSVARDYLTPGRDATRRMHNVATCRWGSGMPVLAISGPLIWWNRRSVREPKRMAVPASSAKSLT